jgi:hypothetical protein
MTGAIDPPAGDYTLAELAAHFGLDLPETAALLEEHGYPVPDGDARLALTAEAYGELLMAAPLEVAGPLGADDATG